MKKIKGLIYLDRKVYQPKHFRGVLLPQQYVVVSWDKQRVSLPSQYQKANVPKQYQILHLSKKYQLRLHTALLAVTSVRQKENEDLRYLQRCAAGQCDIDWFIGPFQYLCKL